VKARSLRSNSDNAGEYKFDEDLTLVTFDEKTPLELLEAFNNVLKHLSKDHDVDVRDEDPHVSSLAINDRCPLRVLFPIKSSAFTFVTMHECAM